MPVLGYSHIQLEWQLPEWRNWYERLAEKRKVIRYDGRGGGLSDRNVIDFSLDSHVRDLEAVVDRLGLERFVLFGILHSGPAAIAYAADHPKRVSHLILWCTYARASDYYEAPEIPGMLALVDKDWRLFTEMVANMVLGWSAGEETRQFADYMRETITPEVMRHAWSAIFDYDVATMLEDVQSPTLVLHRRGIRWLTADMAKGLASRIPRASLNLMEGASSLPFEEDVLTAIRDFLGEGEETAAAPGLTADDIRTILFTDVEGSTALTQRLGDAKAREVLREHERIVREALRAHGGSEVKTMGDGFMASFPSATRALECAIAMQ
ncbi:MAG: adenylate/guanylate cyclase domain-containing protein [Chloroflexota bacterium]|nr:adenylate/guanylate cyclase domain-containing protein [Chloroflexota bacterium]